MKTLTEADSFDASVVVPEGGDPRTAGSVEVPLQALANRSRNLLTRTQALETFCLLRVTGGTYTTSFAKTIAEQSGGFSLDGSGYLLPPANGKYLVTFNLGLKSADTTSPLSILFGSSPTVAGYASGWCARAVRYSASPTELFVAHGSTVVDISSATPGTTDRIFFFTNASVAWSIVNSDFTQTVLVRRID